MVVGRCIDDSGCEVLRQRWAILSNMERAGYRVGFAVVVWSWFRPGRGCRWNKRCDPSIYLVESRFSESRAAPSCGDRRKPAEERVECWTAARGKTPRATAMRGAWAEREARGGKTESEVGR